ncbi:heme-binding protein [Pontixanthobacter aestiaquae]|uniref:Heme-binding protein n=1 Tax=Pontixanthobacter aestiaquae TaxID=1509367 RepID=A0A844Z6H2_9SPHN|nr:heme-binding protein [Pontixanthobacter aestiaquae]MDN3646162.1 heme-binding protein [Pontixanthobacter aestiaquae]MXO82846.1 heme-binding protein [Pontixanthobacter aestiaquae]
MNKGYLAAGLAALAAGSAGAATADDRTEQPQYTVLSSAENIEIREYAPMIVAQAEVAGDRRRAMGRGFRVIADYIFGNNLSQKDIAMTSPVTQQANARAQGEKIAMTSPVTQQNDGETWQVRFIMPSQYTMDTLPRPNNPDVRLIEVPAKKVAVIRFSGWASQDRVDQHEGTLKAYMAIKDLSAAASPTYAFYDAPGTPPERRRNEVMIELAAE